MAKDQEYIIVNVNTPRKYDWSTGKYLGKVYAEAKENKRLMGNKCPKCNQIMWWPTVVCAKCKVETVWEWTELPDTGTVMQYTYLVFPLWDPHYGERWENPYPSAMILLDNGMYMRHWLEEQDADKLKEGMRVKAVWKEDIEDRGIGMQDILYYRTIEE